jgi:hypothetical protein
MGTGAISRHRSTVASEKSDATSESMPPGDFAVFFDRMISSKFIGLVDTSHLLYFLE